MGMYNAIVPDELLHPTGVFKERLSQSALYAEMQRVTDADALRALAAAWFAKYGEDWRYEVRGEEFVEVSHSGGGTEGGAWVYRVAPAKVLLFGGAHGQTRYRF